MKSNSQTLHQQIRRAIADDGRSAAKIARDADINAATLYGLLNGADSRMSIVEKVCAVLGVQVMLAPTSKPAKRR